MKKAREILKGIDESELCTSEGWWETYAGAKYGAKKLAELEEYLQAPPSDAAIHAAAQKAWGKSYAEVLASLGHDQLHTFLRALRSE